MSTDRQTELDRDWGFPTPADADASLPAVPTQHEPALPSAPAEPDLDLSLTPHELDAAQQTSGQPGGATLFGQTIPPHAAHAAAGVIQQLAANAPAELQRLGVRAAIATAASSWFRSAATAPVPREHPAHRYRIDINLFPTRDRPYALSYLNAMARVGASQEEVEAGVRWYVATVTRLRQSAPKQPAPATPAREPSEREWAAVDAADIQACEATLRETWGQSYHQNLETVRGYVARLPRVDRERLLGLTDEAGHAWLNDPQNIIQLHAEAVSNTGPAASLLAEIQRLETYMRENRAQYNRDESAQARLRELYRRRDG